MSKDREIRRLQIQLAEAKDQRDVAEQRCRKAEEVADMAKAAISDIRIDNQRRVAFLQETVDHERLHRVSAQRGLVNYMREHGLADRVGYDPDADPQIQQEIAEGKIPPRNDPRVLKEIAAAVIAERHP